MSVKFTDEEIARGYRVGKWQEHKNYECVECQYSTIFLDKIQKHMENGVHDWSYPVPLEERQSVESDEPTY